MFRNLLAITLLCVCQTLVAADEAIDRIDASTRWTISVAPTAAVQTSIVRLGDVANLVGQHRGWDRIASTPIAMIPAGSMSVTLDRDRLAAVVESIEATPLKIDWVGPTKMVVTRQLKSSTAVEPNVAKPSVRQVAWTRTTDHRDPIEQLDREERLASDTDLERWKRQFESALQRFEPEIAKQFEVAVLSDISAEVAAASIYDIRIYKDENLATVTTRRRGLERNHEISIKLTSHPEIVVPAFAIQRGTLLTSRHLTKVSVPIADVPADAVIDIDSLLGKRSMVSLRSSTPITTSMIGEPLVVRRGEIVQLRAIGGGISVTTNARTLSDGEANELIEVETLQRRKRVIARVVDSTTVEIVTRSPVIR